MKRIIVGLALILVLVSCNQETSTPTSEITQTQTARISTPTATLQTITPTLTPTPTLTSTSTGTPTPGILGPNDFPADVNPLTGLSVTDPAILDRHPVAIKVNIVPRSSNRPPWGLSLADIVYDYYHNDGYSRFYAIFYGNDAELVGPIRSGRLLDHELTRMYQSLFAYGSADQAVNNRLLNAEYANRIVLEGQRTGCPPTAATPLCRYEPSGVDFLLANTQALSEHISAAGVENGRQELDGMTFDVLAPQGGVPGDQVFVRYSGDDYLRWDYDSSTGRYLRFQDNIFDTGQGEEFSPLTDRLNDEPVSTSNVVVLVVRHEYYQRPPNEIVEILLSGTGDAYAFRDGQMYRLTWNRPAINSVLFLTDPDGANFPFKPGNTWFQVIGVSSVVSEPEQGIWRFVFGFP